MRVLTCDGCGGRNLKACSPTEEEMTIRRVGSRVTLRLPLPMLCIDCGGTSHHLKRM